MAFCVVVQEAVNAIQCDWVEDYMDSLDIYCNSKCHQYILLKGEREAV